ncbi:MAG: sulfatase [Caldilineaceae bacterium]
MTSAPQGLHPNLIFVFADQWRYQATGFGGDPNVQTPHLDALAARSLHFTNAISGCPVCCPARASLLTGQYPDHHGVFVNDVHLGTDAVSLAQAYKAGGYDTAYIGKWHVDGHGRSAYIPPERRQGFDFWQVLECTHSYNESYYYAGDDPNKRLWEGYDAIAQTRVAQEYIREHAQAAPYLLVLSWGPPHNPYETAPQHYRDMYDPAKLTLHPNVPAESMAIAREQLAGYYAHCSALDDLVGDLYQTLMESGQLENTILVFWSDHGDMLWSQGQERKQRPWEESIHVPLLIHAPQLFGQSGQVVDAPINTTDLMPTLLGLCDLPVPPTVQGQNYAPFLRGDENAPADAVLLSCYHPFGEYNRPQRYGREYRGIRTLTHTYVRGLTAPWLLYDNVADPYQQQHLINQPQVAALQSQLDKQLDLLLDHYDDEFLPGMSYIERWGYALDETGTVPFVW